MADTKATTRPSKGVGAARGHGRRVAALIRHGHFDRPENTASAHRILPLSETGREQARLAADSILAFCDEHDLELDSRIEVSQLLRAWQTGTILGESLAEKLGRGFVIEERDEIIERSLGSCANLRFDEIKAQLAQDPRLRPLPAGWRRIPEFRLPVQGAESLMQAGARTAMRIATSIDSIPADDPRDLLRLFVAHSGCLRHAAVNLGALEMRAVSGLSMDFCQTILVEKLPDGEWIQLAGQWRKHLPTR
jgi:2,3-bisphosphoglycerate-dependent phosphoglycerate mutase